MFDVVSNRLPHRGLNSSGLLLSVLTISQNEMDAVETRMTPMDIERPPVFSVLRLLLDDRFRHNLYEIKDRIWNRVRTKSNLPDEARPDAQLLVTFAREAAEPPRISAKQRKQLKDWLAAAPEAAIQQALRREKYILEHIPDGRPVISEIDAVRTLWQRIEPFMVKGRGRTDRVPYSFVFWLDVLLSHYTGRHIRRNENDRVWIDDLCQLVDPKIGTGSIDKAMKRVITEIPSEFEEIVMISILIGNRKESRGELLEGLQYLINGE
jgi:hypothetical protein